MMIRTWCLLVAGVVYLLAGCASVPDVPGALPVGREGVLTGTVNYRERIVLPPDALVEVWMIDVSPGMLVLPLIAETAIATQGRQMPIRFELRYDRGKVLPDRSYMVKAAIRSQGRMLFATDEGQRVITKGNPHEAALWLRSATQTPAGDASRLWGTAWRLEDLAGTGVLDRIEAPLEFVAPGKVAGHGSCNRFFGSVEITGASLAFGALGSTRMACAEAIGNQEVNYLQALARAERYVVQGATLFVYAKGTEKPLRFVRKP